MNFQYIQMIFVAMISAVIGEMLQLSENEIDMVNVLKNISVVTITACYMHCSKDVRCSYIGLTRTSHGHLQTCHLLRTNNGTIEKEANKLAVVKVGVPNDNVDGKYTAWSPFGPCSSSVCGVDGKKKRNRTCTNPPPKGDGKDCCHIGRSHDVKSCAPPCIHVLFATTPHTLTKNKLIGTIQTWHKVFKVQFLLKIDPLKLTKMTRYNAVHFTIGENNQVYGDRVPAVYLYRTDSQVRIDIASAVNGNKNYNTVINKNNDYYKNWIKIDISQRLEVDGRYMYKVAIDDHVISDVTNGDARDFENVKIFASSAWRPSYGEIKSFRVEGATGLITAD